MSIGSNELQHALKNLRAHWEEAKAGWNDRVRQDFEDNYLAPLETQVAAAIRGIDRLAEVLAHMRKDCS